MSEMMGTFINRRGSIVKLLLCASLLSFHFSLFISCTQDAYDKGEGTYSLMQGDFGEAYVSASGELASVTIDDGSSYPVVAGATAKWMTTPDSVYRCMLYYNKVEQQRGTPSVEIRSISQVPCPSIGFLSDLQKEVKTDPVKFESAWMSKTGKYLNLSIILMTGKADDEEAIHHLGILCDSVITHPDGLRSSCLRLLHDQGGVPEYYSTKVYLSLPADSIQGDSVRLSLNTYQGEVVKSFSLHR